VKILFRPASVFAGTLLHRPCRALLAALVAALSLVAATASELAYLNLTLPLVGDHTLHILAPTTLELKRLNSKPSIAAPVDNWDFVDANGTFSAPTPAQFAVTVDSVPATVTAVGFKRRPLYAPVLTRDLRIENSLYLQLAVAVAPDQVVTVTNPGASLWPATHTYSATAAPLRYGPAIHVNQEGYVPGLPKRAMIGAYLGDLGELNVSASVGFTLVTAGTSTVVHTGALTLRPDVGYVYTPTPYQRVLAADFSAFTTPGRYQLVVPGLGASLPFAIHEGVAMSFLRTYALGLYHQRCGADNALPFTRHTHAACHLAPAAVPSPQGNYTFTWSTISGKNGDFATNPRHTAPQLNGEAAQLYPFVMQGTVDVSGGHHDAGDYSKYTTNSAALTHLLVFTADAIPGAGALDNLGLPESGDGLSDILQEAKREADYLAKLQDADGGFYFIVYPRNREYESNVLPDAGDAQVVWPKNTVATAAAVAALAQTASSPRFKAAYPAVAALYLKKAKLGWQFLLNAIAARGKDGAYQKITFYGDNYMHDDELAWAACELFVATGEAQYRQKLFEWFPDPSDSLTFRWGWWRMSEGWGNAIRSYAFAARTGRLSAGQLDAAYLAKCEAQIVAAGDDALRWSSQNAYATSFPEETKRVQSAGWYFSLDQASDMAVAHQITPKSAYLDALVGNLNYEGGTNPVNVAYLTGLGQKRQRETVSQYALNDRRVLPPSGIPLGNIQTTFDFLTPYGTELRELVFPSDGPVTAPYPFYDRWADTFNVTTEYIGVNQARSLLAVSALATLTTTQSQPWRSGTATITAPSAVAVLNVPTTLSVQAPGFDLTGARIVWEARDQEPAFGPTYTIAPKNNGAQWVEVEVTLPDGRRLFASTSFNANSTVVNWVAGTVPTGATPSAFGGDAWTWLAPIPATPSGQLAHRSTLVAGIHGHLFENATATVHVGIGDELFAWVYLDPLNPPTEVMLTWTDTSAEHRAYWGANTITWGLNNSPGRRYLGPLPPLGQWVRLGVPASAVALEGSTVTGMAFVLVDGRATWDTAGVTTAVEPPAAPTITTQPSPQITTIGAIATFSVVATGTAPLSYQWSKHGSALPAATAATLTLTNAQATTAGAYAVLVSNSVGSTPSASATLTVNSAVGAPTFSLHPQTPTALIGANLTFTVAATGTAPLTYQWRRNGLPIAGATLATFTLTAVTPVRDNGIYQAVVTNAAGATLSAAAFVNVAVSPTQLLAWGDNAAGQSTPPPTLTDAVSVSAGAAHTLALRADGTVVAWGANTFGQSIVPANLTAVVALAAGAAHSLALRADGTVIAWGANTFGQATVPAGLATVIAVAAGGTHSIALKSDGTIIAWGDNTSGQTTVPAGLSSVVALAAGAAHSAALRADGTVVAWGYNGSGQTSVPPTLTGVTALAAGDYHTLALRTDGTTVAWGWNGYGQTVAPTTLSPLIALAAGGSHSAAQKTDSTVIAWGDNSLTQTNAPIGLGNVLRLAAGAAHTVALRDARALPVIGTQPVNRSVPLGQPATFSVVATGTPAPTYQWRKAGVPLSGATAASFTIPAVTIPDAVTYNVVVTNSVGSVTSGSVTLSYVKITPALTWPTPAAITYGTALSATQLNATATIPGTFSYTPLAGTVLGAGPAQTLAVTFTPTDPTTYNSATATTALTVTLAPQLITFTGPADSAFTADVIPLFATSSSGLLVAFTVVSGPATLTGSSLYLTGPGTVVVRALQVGNTDVFPATPVERTFTVSPNFASWVFAKFTAPELADLFRTGPNAVFGLDGLSNLVKYALALEPRENVVLGLPELSASAPNWIFTYTRPTTLPDLTYTVETSTNLSTWTTTGVTHELVSTAAGLATWRARTPLASATNLFFRLKIVRLGLDTACTPPLGGITFTIPSGQTRALAVPLLHASVGTGAMIARVAAVGANFLDVTSAGWTPAALSTAANPYFVRFRTGTLAGRVLPVAATANTATRVFLSNDGTALTATGLNAGALGDVFELILADTLGTLFNPASLQSGPSPATADSVQIWNGVSWLTYYRHAANNRWQRDSDSTASPTRDTLLLRPDRGLMFTRNASTELKLYVTGRVPDLAPAYWHLRPGVTLLSLGLPVDTTLGALALHTRATGWQSGANYATAAATADLVRAWNGVSWQTYYYDTTGARWQREGDASQANRNTFTLPAGRPVMIHRLTAAPSAAAALLPLVLPYTLAP